MNIHSNSAPSFALFSQNHQVYTQKGFCSDVQFDLNKTLNRLSFATDSSSEEKFCGGKKGARRLPFYDHKDRFSHLYLDSNSECPDKSAFEFLGTHYQEAITQVKGCFLNCFSESKAYGSILNLNLMETKNVRYSSLF